MFKLIENRYIDNGKCKYTDEYGNKAFFCRTESGFTGKLRFEDKRVTAEPIHINLPLMGTKGVDMNINYMDGVAHTDIDIVSGIQSFTELVNYWIDLVTDTKMMSVSNEIIAKMIKAEGDDQIETAAQYKLATLSQYEELYEIVKTLI